MRVIVTDDSGDVKLEWEGYADNVHDALNLVDLYRGEGRDVFIVNEVEA